MTLLASQTALINISRYGERLNCTIATALVISYSSLKDTSSNKKFQGLSAKLRLSRSRTSSCTGVLGWLPATVVLKPFTAGPTF